MSAYTYRLTKEQSDEFCTMVKEVIKRIGVSQKMLGLVAGYSGARISKILNRKEDTTSRATCVAIISALTFLVLNSDKIDLDECTQIVDEMISPCAFWPREF